MLAAAGTVLTAGGRYHELNAIVDRGLAFALGMRTVPGRDRSTIEQWETARRAAPDFAICHRQLAGALRKAGAFDRAEEVLAAAFARFPDDLGTTIEAARLAERRSDHAEAARQWRKVVGRGKPRPVWIAGAAQSLIQTGRVDEAEDLLAGAGATHPALMAARCTLAARKREWAKAVSLSRAFRRRHPKHANSRDLLGESIYAEMLSKLDDDPADGTTAPAAPANVGKTEDEAVRQLLLRFENIGENCEFAFVQRRYGAEPVGLFRWNRIDAEDLVAALDHRLEGLGEPEHTELILIKNEYFVLDRRWFLGMHTFLYADQTTPDELMAAILRRTAALKARFVEDLAAGEKTFVFLSSGLARRTVLDLHRALCTFGPVRLLAVQPTEAGADFEGRPGEIVEVERNCYVGFLRRRGGAADQSWDIAFEDWVAICRKVEAHAGTRPSREREAAAPSAT